MNVAVGQFIVGTHWRINAEYCIALMRQALVAEADLLVLPEAILARSLEDADHAVKSAQTLDGPFITLLREESRLSHLTTLFTIHTPSSGGRAANTLVALRCGEIVACYHKLHLYDAFNMQESRLVDPGNSLAPVIDVAGVAVGLMTCYDLRFPDIALSLALRGAEAIALPAAWLKGAYKEQHWQTLLAARALDTTCYMIAAGECGPRNIGQSRIIDPLGLTLAESGSEPDVIFGQVTGQRVAEVRAQLPVLANRRFSIPQLIADK